MSLNNQNGINCTNIQLLEPDDEVLVATSSGSSDQSLSEFGEVVLEAGQGSVSVVFLTPKAGDYRFEYLYIDDPSTLLVTPGVVAPIITVQTIYGFTVEFAGAPLNTGYILRWRVVVIASPIVPFTIDAPESLRVRLNAGVPTQSFLFQNPRSGTAYGFSELRIENLDDDASVQTVLGVQVISKTISGFTVLLSPVAPDANYFLVARTP